MKIEISLGDKGLKLALDLNATEFMALKKALMWCDFDKMKPTERMAVEQLNRNIQKISIPQ